MLLPRAHTCVRVCVCALAFFHITQPGIRRALPGLDSFLRDRLANEPLSADVGAQLAHLIHQLDKLEGDVVNKEALQEASACRASTSGTVLFFLSP